MYFFELIILASLWLVTSTHSNIAALFGMEPPVSASNKTYKIISYDKKTWQGALEACHVLGLELASINTEEEEENMINLIYSTGLIAGFKWWTSGNDLNQEGQFYWASNGRPITYANWLKGQPNNGQKNQNCLLFCNDANNDFTWDDWQCNVQYNFICES